jgi:alpha-D-ribose 1-methylphosphonate 5-triphosphate synthase subunit PhnG
MMKAWATMTSEQQTIEARQAMMRLCTGAERSVLEAAVERLAAGETVLDLRPAESGLVMLRGRIGGEGQAFNVGEASLTRAAVRLADGTEGHAYQLGRDKAKARLAAILDALWQRSATRGGVEAALLPVAERLAAEAGARASRTAATRVTFFTMTRGDD